MLRDVFWGCVVLSVASLSFAAPPATGPATRPGETKIDPNAMPSSKDLQQMLDDKKYQQVIQITSRLLALKGSSADAYNHFDLLKLKAEAQLQRGDSSSAMTTFAELGRETNDPHQRDVVQATLILIKRSPHGKYVPRTLPAGQDKAQPIDILDPITRKAAFEALFNDERQLVEPRLKSAMTSQSLPPIFPVIEAIMNLRSLDVAASDSDQRTATLTSKLMAHAKKLMTTALDQLAKRQDDISRQANTETVRTQVIMVNGVGTPIQTRSKQGLSDRNIQDLRDMIATAGKIVPVAESLSKLGGTEANMEDVVNSAQELESKAKELLDTKFDTSPRLPGYGQ